MSATVVYKENDRVVMSVVERDASEIDTTDKMTKNTAFKSHSLDGDNKKVFRGWAPAVSADYDFKSTGVANTTTSPAYIKLLQADLPTLAPKCEVLLTCVVEMRGLKNE